MSDGVLSGQSVLVTRPLAQQKGLAEKIKQLGGRVIQFPLIQISPLTDRQAVQAAKTSVQNLDQFNVLIFVSSNAARIGGELIAEFWPQFPVGIEIIAIGETTARAATSLLACPVISPAQGSDSESVLALPELQEVAGKRIGIVRGQGGRELLATELQRRGADVRYIEVYCRDPVTYEAGQLTELMNQNSCNMITVHSGESLDLLIKQAADNIDQITLLPLVVPSERVAQQARETGFTRVANAAGADDSAMIAMLQQLAGKADK